MVLPDVQSSTDRRNIPIQKVGVKGIRTPILVKSQVLSTLSLTSKCT